MLPRIEKHFKTEQAARHKAQEQAQAVQDELREAQRSLEASTAAFQEQLQQVGTRLCMGNENENEIPILGSAVSVDSSLVG